MKTFTIRTMALVAVFALVAFAGCSGDDDPAGPPGGGGSAGLTLPPGVYNTSVVVTTCTGTPIISEGGTETWCSSELVDELPPGIDCTPRVVTADSVTVNCSGTEDDGSCSYSWTATGGGKKVGDMWTLNVRVEISNQSPPGCFTDSTCMDMVLSADRVDDPPSACTYADANTFDATVVGGPMAGKVPFRLGGSATSGTSGIQWSFGGSYPEQIFRAQSSAGLAGGWNIGIDLNPIGPKTTLPFTANVIASGGLANSAGQSDGFVYYSEYDPDTGHQATSSGGGGTVTVEELTLGHIAGTISLNIDMIDVGQQASAAQQTTPRTITGGFFVMQSLAPQQSFAASLGQRLLQSLRTAR